MTVPSSASSVAAAITVFLFSIEAPGVGPAGVVGVRMAARPAAQPLMTAPIDDADEDGVAAAAAAAAAAGEFSDEDEADDAKGERLEEDEDGVGVWTA